jgi:hypothetical protein
MKKIRDQSLAMEVYAYQAKDRQLIAFAAEMKRRAQRRIGELMQALGLKPGRPRKKWVSEKPISKSLKRLGVGKRLANAARKDAAMSADKFELEHIRPQDQIAYMWGSVRVSWTGAASGAFEACFDALADHRPLKFSKGAR